MSSDRRRTTLEAALAYAAHGWHVFPAPPGEKKSCKSAEHSGGRKWGMTLDPDEIERDWERWPDANIGIVTGPESGIFVVEADTKEGHGVDGLASLAELERQNGPLPKTRIAESPSGSVHYYFKWIDGVEIKNSASSLGPGIDVRGNGGMVIAPPSVRKDGTYRWLNDLEPAEAPPWLIAAVTAASNGGIPEHLRNYRSTGIGADLPDSGDIELALRAIPNADVGWETWNKTGMAVFAASGGSADGLRLFHDWSRKSKKHDAAKTDAKWAALCRTPPTSIGAGSLFYWANEADPNWRHANIEKPAEPTTTTTVDPLPLFELFWHGKEYDRELRAWLVKDLIFETGTGLASGQWGTAKTFGVLDLAASAMTKTLFVGREVVRQGGVVFVAAEGASEIPIRLKGVVEQKLRPEAERAIAAGAEPVVTNLDKLPFTWIEDCPNLQDANSFNKLVATARHAADVMAKEFDLPLALIVIDTLSATGNFKDQDDAAEGQLIMNGLAELSRQTGAFVLAVDHFGKSVETGTRGTSVKEASADVILAWLADRQLNGTISNTRMALRKLRGGQVGMETPFSLRTVNMGDGETTCVVEWQASRTTAQTSTAAKDRWPKSLRIFRAAMSTALTEHGRPIHPYGGEGEVAPVRAVPDSEVRHEFMVAYPADASDAKGKDGAKRKAFTRALKQARDNELVCSREIGGIDYLWLVEGTGTPESLTF